MRSSLALIVLLTGCSRLHGPADGGVFDGGWTDGPCASGAACNGETGLCAPLAGTGLEVPRCRTTASDRAAFDDGPPRTWTDPVTGEARAACVARPAGASPASPRPLLIFLHGSSGSADDLYDHTSLRARAATFDLAGDGRPGFFVLADQGRTLPNPNGNLGTQPRHDIYYRDFSTASTQPDVRALDHAIDELVATGEVDARRIHVAGWSNGAFFAQAYAIARHGVPTPGGALVAAAPAYAGGDPFANTTPTQEPTCAVVAPLRSDVPLYVIHRSCDAAVGCDAAQQQRYGMPPGYDVVDWVAALAGTASGASLRHVIIDADGNVAPRCASSCGLLAGLGNHLRWPDGVADGGGHDWEPDLLAFLRDHPRP